jgi:hypothetical protein
VAARRAGLDLVNLGFSGNAVLDPFTAQAIRDQPADLITLKTGINVVDHDCMRLRAFRPAVEGFLDVVRDGHRSTPVVVISPILCPMVEDCPGPTEIDPSSPDDAMVFRTLGRPEELARDKLSLRVIRQVLREVVNRRCAAGDTALTYLDGLTSTARRTGSRSPCRTCCTRAMLRSATSVRGSRSCCPASWTPPAAADGSSGASVRPSDRHLAPGRSRMRLEERRAVAQVSRGAVALAGRSAVPIASMWAARVRAHVVRPATATACGGDPAYGSMRSALRRSKRDAPAVLPRRAWVSPTAS